MIRHLLAGVAALTLMTGAAFAQNGYSSTTTTTVTGNANVPEAPVPAGRDPGANMVAGGMGGAALGAVIGCLATIPIGCAPGAGVGAAIGAGTGGVIGVAATPAPYYYPPTSTQQ